MKTRVPTIALASTFFALLFGISIGNWLSENRLSKNETEFVAFVAGECEEDRQVIATVDQSNWTAEQKNALAGICEIPAR